LILTIDPNFLGHSRTVDGSEIRRENQLRLVVYPIIYRVLYIYIRQVVQDFCQYDPKDSISWYFYPTFLVDFYLGWEYTTQRIHVRKGIFGLL